MKDIFLNKSIPEIVKEIKQKRINFNDLLNETSKNIKNIRIKFIPGTFLVKKFSKKNSQNVKKNMI